MSRSKEEIQKQIEFNQRMVRVYNTLLDEKLKENEEWKKTKSDTSSVNITGGTFINSQVGDNSVPPNSDSEIKRIKETLEYHQNEITEDQKLLDQMK